MVFSPARRRPRGDGLVGAERGHRQRLDRLGLLAIARRCGHGAWRVSVRAQTEVPAIAALTAKPCARQRAAHELQQRGLAAEQMGAAGDVEKQAVRRIERHQRREAVAPVGDVVRASCVGRLVGIEHRQFADRWRGHWRAAGRSQGRARAAARRARKSQRVVLLGDDDAGQACVIADVSRAAALASPASGEGALRSGREKLSHALRLKAPGAGA